MMSIQRKRRLKAEYSLTKEMTNMTVRTINPTKRIIAMLLSLVMVISFLPRLSASAQLVDTTKEADPSTMTTWEDFFGTSGTITTEHAGGIWTDKSVFTDASSFTGLTDAEGSEVTLSVSDNSFLVALSALGSNSLVMGQNSAPTDTMLVLDMSNSMSNTAMSTMITATNNAIRTLLSINENNRVGVVLYSTTAHVLLPLDTYTGVSINGTEYFLSFNNNSISTAIATSEGRRPTYAYPVNSNNEAVDISVQYGGGTYIQGGLWAAWEEFSSVTDTTVTDDAGDTVKRTPIMVLMTDGEPTYTTDQYNAVPDNANYGIGSDSYDGDGFVTQLTAAYVKSAMAKKYATDALFYTVGLEVDDLDIAKAILDPANNQTTALANLWANYLNAGQNGSINVTMYTEDNRGQVSSSSVSISRLMEIKEQVYVDKYFGSTSVNDLISVFQNIVNEISLTAGYYPTRLDDNGANFAGYVTFVDELGSGMEVKAINGILIGSTLYTGKHLAKAMLEGEFGTKDEPTELGNNLVWALEKRLGITEQNTAWALLEYAWENGHLSYNSDTGEYSNYIAWYGDAEGNYLGYELTDSAVYYNMCYGMIGSIDGNLESDMMYITIQVSTDLKTGNQSVTFKIPASLLPVVTYKISVNDVVIDENTEGTLSYEAADPISLIYEVGVRDDVDSRNVIQYAKQVDGKYYLYTNAWDIQAGGSLDNPDSNSYTYAYFEPSAENEHYYFTEDAVVYALENGEYVAATQIVEGQTYYFAHRIFTTVDDEGTMKVAYFYEALSSSALAVRQVNADGVYYIPDGTMHWNMHSHDLQKSVNATGTYQNARYQIVDAVVNSSANHHYELMYLGNNGRLMVQPAQGIIISKVMDDGSTPDTEFTFTVALTGAVLDESYPVIYVAADGTETQTTVQVVDSSLTVSLKAGESVYILELPTDTRYVITEKENDVYQVQHSSGASGTVAAHQISAVTFTNEKIVYSTLSIAKTVAYNNGTEIGTDGGREFTVTVTLKKADGTVYAGKRVYVDSAEQWTNDDGEITFTIKDGKVVTITNLPVGVTYTVSESDLPNGYTWENPNDSMLSGTITQSGNAVLLSNSYTPDHVTINDVKPAIHISGTKTVVNAAGEPIAWSDDFAFTFTLYRWNAETAAWEAADEPVTVTQSGAENISLSLAGQEFAQVGTYYFRISETVGTRGGMTYDVRQHDFSVTVTDVDLDGVLEIGDVTSIQHAQVSQRTENGEQIDVWDVTTNFVNTFEASSTKLGFRAFKILDGRDMKDGEFLFQLYQSADDTYETLTKLDDAYNGIGGDIVFETVTYTAAGTYYYLIEEVAGDDDLGVTYDSSRHKVEVTVEEIDGQYTVTKLTVNGTEIEDKNLDDREITFNNTYTVSSVEVEFTASKTLNGKTLTEGAFSFVLTGSGENQTKTNAADGSVIFDSITYTEAGTYTYTISEEIPKEGAIKDGITYDTTVYNVTVVVIDNGEGELVVTSVVYEAGGIPVEKITFTNTYTASPAVITLSAVKDLVGRTMQNGEFSFRLKDEDGNVIETVSNYANGTVVFGELSFDQTGVYIFTICEEAGQLGGVTYSDKVYTVTVTVTDNGKGQLVAEADINGSDILFTNLYEAASVDVVFTGIKYMEGRNLLPGEFEFELLDEEGNELQVVRNGDDGVITFSAITFDKPGEFTYTIKEKATTKGGVTIDGTQYTVTVTVTDNGTGALVAEVKVNGSGDQSVVFTNKYHADEVTVDLTAKKNLTGREAKAGEFSFVIKDSEGNQVGSTAENAADSTITFDTLTFDKVGVYTYTVEEVNGGKTIDGVTYDSTVYTVVINVSDNGEGELQARITVNGSTSTEIVFNNTYTATDKDGVILQAGKTINGQTPDTQQFQFVLKDGDGNLLQTVTNDGGSIVFEKITYDKAGVYTYTIEEINAGQRGYSYDSTVYTVTVTVTDDGNGNLTAEASYSESGTAPVFRNTYVPDQTGAVLGGAKTLIGKDLTAGTYSFVLKAADGTEIETVENKGDGSFSFTEIVYDTIGIYRYTISEVGGGTRADGVTYDKSVYNVTVTVTDEGGWLKATVVYTKNGEEASVAFTNTYEAMPVQVSLKAGGKTYTNLHTGESIALTGGEFSFVLKDAEGNVLQTVKNDSDGAFFFKDLSFETVDTYIYTVEEVIGEVNGVTYSREVYTATIQVSDNGKGQLEAKVSYTKGEQSVTEDVLSFVNTYRASKTSIVLSGLKTLLGGRDLREGEFSFVLMDAQGNEIETVSNSADGTFTFAQIDFENPGTYTFLVEEVRNNVEGVTYDTTRHTVTVTVTDQDGQLQANVLINDREDVKNLGFTNIFIPDDVTVAVVTVQKTLDNRSDEEMGLAGFRFALEDLDTLDVVYATTDDSGIARFEMTFTSEDIGKTYTFKLTEVDTGIEDMTYSQSVYEIVVSIGQDPESGMLIIMVTRDGEETEENAEFVNVYEPKEEPTEPSDDPGNPKTGDSVHTSTWTIMMMLSIVSALFVMILGKKGLFVK